MIDLLYSVLFMSYDWVFYIFLNHHKEKSFNVLQIYIYIYRDAFKPLV